MEVWAGLASPEASLLGLDMAAFSPSPHVVCVLISFYKDINHIALGPTLKDFILPL